MIYIFYYKNDIKCEPLGRVMATSLDDARNQISIIKQLTVNLIDELFVIKTLEDHENNF
jgi:hypothetical protein